SARSALLARVAWLALPARRTGPTVLPRISPVTLRALRPLRTGSAVLAVSAVADVEDAGERVELPAAVRTERGGLDAGDSGRAVDAGGAVVPVEAVPTGIALVTLRARRAVLAVQAGVALQTLGAVVTLRARGPRGAGGTSVALSARCSVVPVRTGGAPRPGLAGRVPEDLLLALLARLAGPEDTRLSTDTSLDRRRRLLRLRLRLR